MHQSNCTQVVTEYAQKYINFLSQAVLMFCVFDIKYLYSQHLIYIGRKCDIILLYTQKYIYLYNAFP
jgi:hypothetical protein